jgi:hypothetical protein
MKALATPRLQLLLLLASLAMLATVFGGWSWEIAL